MHQTFYIDVDEEVNSIISRIRKSSAKYNILVISHGALIMQSAVSLKLIKKEFDLLDKKIMIITRDERAAAIAKKIGFAVKDSLDDLNGAAENRLTEKNLVVSQDEEQEILPRNEKLSEVENLEKINKKNRLSSLGSDNFVSIGGIVKRDGGGNFSEMNNQTRTIEPIGRTGAVNNLNPSSESDEFMKLFADNPKSTKVAELENNVSAGGVLKFLWFFILTLVVLVGGIGAYLYLPKADVVVFPKKEEQNLNLKLDASENATATTSLSTDTITLKSKIIEDEAILSLTFDATGDKSASNQKARGKITIYNEFSETSQVLVATTRFLSNDNKLFRLLNTVTVPAMVVKDGKTEPGTIEADIIADESGSDFNIKEATFNIPGFKGSSKYDKFYAKLTQETKGGGSSENELRTVAKSDIDSAKFKIETQIKTQLKESIKNKLGADNILLDDALAYEVLDFSVFPEEGSVTDKFEYQVKMKVKALAFSDKELSEKLNEYIKNKTAQKTNSAEIVSIGKEYGRADIDFSKKNIKAELNVNAKMKSVVDAEKISNYLVNKNKDEISDILDDYPEVDRVEAVISPSFVSNSFPRYASRIKITINAD